MEVKDGKEIPNPENHHDLRQPTVSVTPCEWEHDYHSRFREKKFFEKTEYGGTARPSR